MRKWVILLVLVVVLIGGLTGVQGYDFGLDSKGLFEGNLFGKIWDYFNRGDVMLAPPESCTQSPCYINSCGVLNREGTTYILTGNVDVPAEGTCFEIVSDNIILDGGGNLIHSGDKGVWVRDGGSDTSDVIIRNLHLGSFEYGVFLTSVGRVTIDNVDVISPAVVPYGVHAQSSSYITIQNCDMNSVNGGVGVDILGSSEVEIRDNTFNLFGVGVSVWYSDHVDIIDNTMANANAGTKGIYVTGDYDNHNLDIRIIGNTINGFEGDGISGSGVLHVLNTDSGVILGNEITGNGVHGISVEDSPGIQIGDGNSANANVVSGNEGNGLFIDGGLNQASGTIIYKNTIENNGGEGIFISARESEVIGNTIRSNGESGIYVWSHSCFVDSNEISGSLIGVSLIYDVEGSIVQQNIIENISSRGIYLRGSGFADPVEDIEIRDNVIEMRGGSGTGIQLLYADNNLVSGNDASFGFEGIRVAGENNDLYGNEIHNNEKGIIIQRSNNSLLNNDFYSNVYGAITASDPTDLRYVGNGGSVVLWAGWNGAVSGDFGLDRNFVVEDNHLELDVGGVSGLNSLIKVSLFGVPWEDFDSPVILMNGAVCDGATEPSCEIISGWQGSPLKFEASGWGSPGIRVFNVGEWIVDPCGNGTCDYPSEDHISCPEDCSTWCGDLILTDPNSEGVEEVCDGSVQHCDTGTLYLGEETCSPDCLSWGTCVAVEWCGDGDVNGDEECDGGEGCDEDCMFEDNCVDGDGDGYNVTETGCGEVDCNDTASSIYPGAPELCDGVDNNCGGGIDEGGDALCSGDTPYCESGGCVECTVETQEADCGIGNVCVGGECVDGMIDVGVVNLAIVPSDPLIGDNVVATATFENLGDFGTNVSWGMSSSSPGPGGGGSAHCYLNPGESFTMNLSLSADLVGDYSVSASISSMLFDVNPENDQMRVEFSIVGCVESSECDNSLWCDGVEVCQDGNCIGGTSPCADDNVACTTVLCDEATDQCNVPNDFYCDDGISCTVESCDSELDCVYEVHNLLCSDQNYCNGLESCNLTLGCVAGEGVVCEGDDGIDCTDPICDEINAGCVQEENDTLCDQGFMCLADEGGCVDVSDSVCGNGVIELGEECECGADGICENGDDNLTGETCESQGFPAGNLTATGLVCGFDCTFNTSDCSVAPLLPELFFGSDDFSDPLVNGARLVLSDGEIRFFGLLDFSQLDLVNNMEVSSGRIGFNMARARMHQINAPATLNYYGFTEELNEVSIVKVNEDGSLEVCGECSYLYDSELNQYLVGVFGFSTYVISEKCGNGICEVDESCSGCVTDCGQCDDPSGDDDDSNDNNNNDGPAQTYQCSDGIDNDGDGLVDYPADTGCVSTLDNTELDVSELLVGGDCLEDWQCDDWRECTEGTRTRSCVDLNNCGTGEDMPPINDECGLLDGEIVVGGVRLDVVFVVIFFVFLAAAIIVGIVTYMRSLRKKL
ncbi:MAG: right-handed parallel beta-helix repeat-containing protein [archaeon]